MRDTLSLIAPAGQLPIGTEWRTVAAAQDVVFPYDGSVVAQAPVSAVQDSRDALDAAEAARPEVAALTTAQRKSVLLAVHDRLKAEAERFVDLLILETGKPRVDCQVEINRTIVTLQATSEEVSRIHGETVPLDLQELGRGMIGYYSRKPAGVVVGIAGFNYPVLLASHKLAPAIAAGCPVIIKPAPNTPLATLELVAIVREVLVAHGITAAAVQLVNGAPEIGEVLVRDPRAQVVSFTGSAKIGHLIAQQAAPRKTLLELGSNTGFIVAADADVDAAVDAVLRGGFYANGQACISVQRVVLERPVAAAFTERLLARMGEVVVGDPRAAETTVAPVINAASGDRIRALLADAVAAGATVLAGEGAPGAADPTANAALVQPTVLGNVPADSEAWAEEIFGPVVCLTEVDSMDEAIDLVNASRYGLQAAIYTSSLESAFAAIERLEVGGVVVNEIPGFRSDIMPYGGVKDSGVGREGPRYAIEEFTVTRMAMIRPRARS
ncbi:aldehyde dehydrogenase family protein [Leucobacter luti]|uniref:Acyl-CoA reductase-like NAD-dependent aldehyde dehydrogenase n=1 Tax=Leucobacter luti TaxID=340320 RepID=A0A4Q7TV48_9MICO|nr:aldehyde dehydrogenase family protein [Leucobacter luti]MBL3698292.1 aldehyde dehydrogenase family protein [Leucobacter luti]RZT64623.1 acyl-CoA reductase-like NAD-dependent aldehyde dehydrogenase [Leucobacter luti]